MLEPDDAEMAYCAVIIYGGFVALLYLAQRSLQYFPSGVANQIVHGPQALQEMIGTQLKHDRQR